MTEEPSLLSQILCVIFCLFITGGFIFFLCLINRGIDFLKNKVAFDLEWNSKDQTFDRDLLAMRTYFDCGLVDVGVIITRSEELNEIFKAILDDKGTPLIKKYGASTTWMGKLIYRLKSRRNGGCPILAIGIKQGCIVDWGK